MQTPHHFDIAPLTVVFIERRISFSLLVCETTTLNELSPAEKLFCDAGPTEYFRSSEDSEKPDSSLVKLIFIYFYFS